MWIFLVTLTSVCNKTMLMGGIQPWKLEQPHQIRMSRMTQCIYLMCTRLLCSRLAYPAPTRSRYSYESGRMQMFFFRILQDPGILVLCRSGFWQNSYMDPVCRIRIRWVSTWIHSFPIQLRINKQEKKKKKKLQKLVAENKVCLGQGR